MYAQHEKLLNQKNKEFKPIKKQKTNTKNQKHGEW